jgi:hypothetical protein
VKAFVGTLVGAFIIALVGFLVGALVPRYHLRMVSRMPEVPAKAILIQPAKQLKFNSFFSYTAVNVLYPFLPIDIIAVYCFGLFCRRTSGYREDFAVH